MVLDEAIGCLRSLRDLMGSLWFDDRGRKIERLEVVEVNGKYLTMVDEEDGERYLKGLPRGFRVETIELVEEESTLE